MYDPQQKTLLADKGEIRVGSRYQAEVPDKPLEGTNLQFLNLKNFFSYIVSTTWAREMNVHIFFYKGEDTDNRKMEELEDLIWNPENGLTDRQVDQFLIISR